MAQKWNPWALDEELNKQRQDTTDVAILGLSQASDWRKRIDRCITSYGNLLRCFFHLRTAAAAARNWAAKDNEDDFYWWEKKYIYLRRAAHTFMSRRLWHFFPSYSSQKKKKREKERSFLKETRRVILRKHEELQGSPVVGFPTEIAMCSCHTRLFFLHYFLFTFFSLRTKLGTWLLRKLHLCQKSQGYIWRATLPKYTAHTVHHCQHISPFCCGLVS